MTKKDLKAIQYCGKEIWNIIYIKIIYIDG